MDKQIIYILTNPAMEGYIKIGRTTNLQRRLPELDNTSVPVPFECIFAIEVEDRNAEKLVHDAFDDFRVRPNREFFEMSPERAISALRLTGGNEVLLEQAPLEKEDIAALEKAKKRRDRFSFTLVDIEVGSELNFYKDETIVCTVVANNRVEFNSQIMSLSQAAFEAITSLGYNWSAISGPAFWCYNGETLDNRRRRMEDE